MQNLSQLPSILLMGLKKSGKTSIQKVVFERLMPHDTAALPTTTIMEARRVDTNQFVRFEVWDCPGQTDALSSDDAKRLLQSCGAIVFVVDSTERVEEPLERLVRTIAVAHQQNPGLNIEVFVHKTDLLNESQQHELVRKLSRAVEESFKAAGGKPPGKDQVSYYRTSIYDHSVFRAFSVVVQRLVKMQQKYVANLVALLASNSQADVVYLFLSKTKIYIAHDIVARELEDVYEICSDALDMMTRLDAVYGSLGRKNKNEHANGNADDGEGEAALESNSSSVIHLTDQHALYVREIPNDLTVVMILKQEKLGNKAVIDYNLTEFSNAVSNVFLAGQRYLQNRTVK